MFRCIYFDLRPLKQARRQICSVMIIEWIKHHLVTTENHLLFGEMWNRHVMGLWISEKTKRGHYGQHRKRTLWIYYSNNNITVLVTTQNNTFTIKYWSLYQYMSHKKISGHKVLLWNSHHQKYNVWQYINVCIVHEYQYYCMLCFVFDPSHTFHLLVI